MQRILNDSFGPNLLMQPLSNDRDQNNFSSKANNKFFSNV
jgi:hypothetical protein